MLGRIDAWHTIAQQALYLVVVTAALLQMLLEETPPRYAGVRSALLHFLLGTLLNIYTIFYFKSSSFLVSFGFLALLVALLLANESKRLAALGLPFKFALLSLAWVSFAALVVPIAAGRVGSWIFLASVGTGCIPLGLAGLTLARKREIFVPLGAVVALFLLFYFFRLTPPVPLSIPFMGVYHGVERTPEGYRLSHERPAWRIWHHGDQWFAAQPGERVYVYFRVFSPAHFADQLTMRWYLDRDGWVLTDAIPIQIVGGREAGFRGYGVKANWQPGRWRVLVETVDGREIGRIYFRIDAAQQAAREFSVEID